MSASPLMDIGREVVAIKRAPKAVPPWAVQSWNDYLLICWQRRHCFVCLEFGWCQHRERAAESVEEFEQIRVK